jgi:hypothetical protein
MVAPFIFADDPQPLRSHRENDPELRFSADHPIIRFIHACERRLLASNSAFEASALPAGLNKPNPGASWMEVPPSID